MANPASTHLSIRDVHVYYGSSHVLQGTSLECLRGKLTAIVGRNGVGKTTLIHTLMGLLPVRSGSLLLDREGQTVDLKLRPAWARRELGVALVPQGRRLFRSLTVEEHLTLVPPIKPRPYDLDAIYAIFPRLQERRRARANTLSGGEQSMLAISRALILNADILLMDEPTEGLAPLLVDAIGDVIRGLAESGLTVLLVEQKLKFALNTADQIAIMERGRILEVFDRDAITDADALSQMILTGNSPSQLPEC